MKETHEQSARRSAVAACTAAGGHDRCPGPRECAVPWPAAGKAEQRPARARACYGKCAARRGSGRKLARGTLDAAKHVNSTNGPVGAASDRRLAARSAVLHAADGQAAQRRPRPRAGLAEGVAPRGAGRARACPSAARRARRRAGQGARHPARERRRQRGRCRARRAGWQRGRARRPGAGGRRQRPAGPCGPCRGCQVARVGRAARGAPRRVCPVVAQRWAERASAGGCGLGTCLGVADIG